VPRGIRTGTHADYWRPLPEDEHPESLEVDYDDQHSDTSNQHVALEEATCEEWICPVCKRRTSTEVSNGCAPASCMPNCGTSPPEGKGREILTAATLGTLRVLDPPEPFECGRRPT